MTALGAAASRSRVDVIELLQGISRALHRRLGERLAWYAACFRAPTQPQLQHPHPQPGVAGQGKSNLHSPK